ASATIHDIAIAQRRTRFTFFEPTANRETVARDASWAESQTDSTDRFEVDEAAGGLGRDQPDLDRVADVEALLVAHHQTLCGRPQQAHEGALVSRARDDRIEGL